MRWVLSPFLNQEVVKRYLRKVWVQSRKSSRAFLSSILLINHSQQPYPEVIQERLRIIEFFDKYGQEATREAFGVARSTVYPLCPGLPEGDDVGRILKELKSQGLLKDSPLKTLLRMPDLIDSQSKNRRKRKS